MTKNYYFKNRNVHLATTEKTLFSTGPLSAELRMGGRQLTKLTRESRHFFDL